MSLIVLIVVAVLLWGVLAVPLAMLVGKLSRVNDPEATATVFHANDRQLVHH